MLLGLVRATAGTATIDGHRYADIPNPLDGRRLGPRGDELPPGPHRAQPPARAGRRRRGARTRASTSCSSSSASRPPPASGPAATRWACASGSGSPRALLGDPHVIILDEPANGLDPEGIRWLRGFLRHLADEGRTLLISSHMLSEVEQTVDDVVIIANGKRVAQGTVGELRGEPAAFVRTSDPDRLSAGLAGTRARR